MEGFFGDAMSTVGLGFDFRLSRLFVAKADNTTIFFGSTVESVDVDMLPLADNIR